MSEPVSVTGRRATWLARAFFGGHLALIAFSTIAMLTILNGPAGDWAMQQPAATILPIAWRFSGPTYVVLGALSMLAFLVGTVGWRRALLLAGASAAISLGAELLGTSTGLPFGDYQYTPLLGYRVAGLVPFPIPLSWFYMLVASLAVVSRLAARRGGIRSPWRLAALAALVLLAWDVAMDPSMVHTAHWLWGSGGWLRNLRPAALAAFFTSRTYYGMPLSNWLGWYLTGVVIARVMLAIVPPREVARHLTASTYPVLLYAANGVMPVALCFRDGLWWAAWLGALLMAIPAALALRAGGSLAHIPVPPSVEREGA